MYVLLHGFIGDHFPYLLGLLGLSEWSVFSSTDRGGKGMKKFSPEIEEGIIRVAQRTWDVIGEDIFRCIEKFNLSRGEVMEVVLDAGHMQAHGLAYENDPQVVEVIKKMYEPEYLPLVRKAVKKAFPFRRYGL